MRTKHVVPLAGAVMMGLMAFAGSANATIVGITGFTSAPPAVLGPYAMTPFGDDPRPVIEDVSSVTGVNGTTVNFSPDLSHREVGNGWATWSHGYTGDVYYSNGETSITLDLSGGVDAFYFYAQPNPFSVHEITAIAFDQFGDQTVLASPVDGDSGAVFYGFYGLDGQTIDYIVVSSDVDFAVGEFGSHVAPVPLPAALPMLLSGLAVFGLFKRRSA